MRVIVIRCQNGVVVWVRKRAKGLPVWHCTRDGFDVAGAVTESGVEQFLVALAQHSVTLSGAILQVVELEV